MATLLLHGRQIASVFELLGSKENDITYSLGWALANSPGLTNAVLSSVLSVPSAPPVDTVRLQERGDDPGITDIEILGNDVHAIVEAKRGWQLPTVSQLELYAPRLRERARSHQILVTMSEATSDYASLQLPKKVKGIPVVHMSWRDVVRLTHCRTDHHAEKRLLQELRRYLARIVSMQNQESNLVYVVSLGPKRPPWSELSWIDIVEQESRYFHPVGSTAGWPKEPPNYLGFRYGGKLQCIRHIQDWKIVEDLDQELPFINHGKLKRPHFLYELGAAIRPSHDVSQGSVYPSGRVWAMLDLLLTCDTVSEARDLTKIRRQEEAGS